MNRNIKQQSPKKTITASGKQQLIEQKKKEHEAKQKKIAENKKKQEEAERLRIQQQKEEREARRLKRGELMQKQNEMAEKMKRDSEKRKQEDARKVLVGALSRYLTRKKIRNIISSKDIMDKSTKGNFEVPKEEIELFEENKYPDVHISESESESQSESDDDKPPLGGVTSSRSRYDDKKLEEKMEEIKMSAGLLYKPSELLPIGSAYYYEKKREENLTDFEGQNKKLKKEMDKIKAEAETVWKNAYEFAKNETKDEDIPQDKIREVADRMMKLYVDQKLQIIELQFPFLKL